EPADQGVIFADTDMRIVLSVNGLAVLASGQIWLAVLAVLFSLIGAFYYLRVVKLMYFDEPADQGVIFADTDMRIVLSVNGLAVLVLGLMPDSLMTACSAAIVKTLAS
ncbi:MAG: hypothetical protein NTY70_16320, partial [Burkholderiales bacterium]|nr:hypothetical protein [Burkholderiales bacterium]